MRVKILGCSGGIGGKRRTTSMLVDDDILIDAGTGVMDLSLLQLGKINHIFLTHCHLDHICSIPLLVDSVMGMRSSPITIYTLKETEATLRENIFNWKVWPDFTEIPDALSPLLRFESIEVGQKIILNQREISVLPANHTVPAIGFLLEGRFKRLAFTGDTTYCEALWGRLNNLEQLDYLIIESAMSNEGIEIAKVAKHFYPNLLLEKIKELTVDPQVLVTHLKPDEEREIKSQLLKRNVDDKMTFLKANMIFDI